jgi:pimeloyl-ACP methyl ester carboxylesterase
MTVTPLIATSSAPSRERVVTVETEAFDLVDVRLSERGRGPAVLLLHGGDGPASMDAYAERLSATSGVRSLVPTHPGFAGTPRAAQVTTVGDLAEVYAALLDELGLEQVTVVGSSLGGWVAAELGLLRSPRVGRLVLVDAVGIEAPGHRVADVFSLTFEEIAELSYHDPRGRAVDPAALTPAGRLALAGNRAALALYAGQPAMTDPGLLRRLAGIPHPTRVVWGADDGIADPGYGRVLAAAVPGATFELLPATGHLPHVESPDLLDAVIAPAVVDRVA